MNVPEGVSVHQLTGDGCTASLVLSNAPSGTFCYNGKDLGNGNPTLTLTFSPKDATSHSVKVGTTDVTNKFSNGKWTFSTTDIASYVDKTTTFTLTVSHEACTATSSVDLTITKVPASDDGTATTEHTVLLCQGDIAQLNGYYENGITGTWTGDGIADKSNPATTVTVPADGRRTSTPGNTRRQAAALTFRRPGASPTV
ncbi:MAG: hypothetical protein IJ933_04730, partial [Bacteroidales bacterium]|nr:hypothetical protein [Bacteroidales bacterium]